jgi:4-cresol dehydrogenase (hydroxylating)
VPARADCVLLDLGRLDRIIEFDDKLGYLTVEPSVTFAQGSEFLRAQAARHYLSTIGGSKDASLLANALERGDGSGPCGDRAAFIGGLEVVLPDGEILHSGFERFGDASCAKLHRFGVGPSLDGLFMQSNLGIVTRATIWLARRPAVQRHFACKVVDQSALEQTIDAAQDLFARGILGPGGLSVWNVYKYFAREGRYPWRLMDGRTPLCMGERGLTEPWFFAGTIDADSDAHAAASIAAVETAFTAVAAQFDVLDVESLGVEARAQLDPGTPVDANLRTAYWRKRGAIPTSMDLDRDRCGVIWVCPSFPFDGAQIAAAMAQVHKIGLDHGFEPHVGFLPTSQRSMNGYISLMYDREVAGEDERAMACHDALMRALIALGHYPYRLGIQSMHALPPARGAHDLFLNRVRRMLDPYGIIAPGRYEVS